ncbi:MAG: hypothetical protein AAFV38_05175, partial [Pseudomonadota bacterium]
MTDETEQKPSKEKTKSGKRTVVGILCAWAFDACVVVALLVGLAVLTLPGREITAPSWVASRAEAWLSNSLPGATVDISRVGVTFGRFGAPRVTFHGATLTNATGAEVLNVPALRVGLAEGSFLAATPHLRRVEMSGATIVVSRQADGQVDLGFNLATPETGDTNVSD